MRTLFRPLMTAGLALGAGLTLAQPKFPTEFPEGAQPLPAAALTERISGKVYTAKLAAGPSWRLDFKGNGYVFVDVSTGPRDSGKWRAEDGRVCFEFRGPFGTSCAPMRATADSLYLKRDSNGEVLLLTPQ